MISIEFLQSVFKSDTSFRRFVYSIRNYRLQLFLAGFYQIDVTAKCWLEMIFENVIKSQFNAHDDYFIINQENFWAIISGERTPQPNKEIEKLYYEKLPKYIARHPKTDYFAIYQVIDDYGRD